MIHFDFTVSDADAENIFAILRDRIVENHVMIMNMIGVSGQEDSIADYRQDNEYIEGLIKKMTNTRVVQ